MPPTPCESCGKNAATVHLTEIIDGAKREVHYCEECAQKEGIGPLTPQSLFSHLMGSSAESSSEESGLTCPKCGLTYSEFRQRGRLGCGEDYGLFKAGIVPLLEKIHGSTQHLGKIPVRAGDNLKAEREIVELRRDLTRAIQREEYEKAAELRDRIRNIEEERDSGSA